MKLEAVNAKNKRKRQELEAKYKQDAEDLEEEREKKAEADRKHKELCQNLTMLAQQQTPSPAAFPPTPGTGPY